MNTRSAAGLFCLLTGILLILIGLYWSTQIPHDLGDVAKVAKGWIDGWLAIGVGTTLAILGGTLIKGAED